MYSVCCLITVDYHTSTIIIVTLHTQGYNNIIIIIRTATCSTFTQTQFDYDVHMK